MSPFLAELLGTMFLILLGNGVVANVSLNRTKGNDAGLIVIAFGWALAVFVGVFVSSHGSAGHINPAVTIAMAAFNGFSWAEVPIYLAAQMLGAMIGQILVWLAYRDHYNVTMDGDTKLGTFCTSPQIPNHLNNLITESIGTFALVLGVLFIAKPDSSLGSLDALPVAMIVLAIGVSLGGPTGYAINPARDLAPRIMHAFLPLPNKGDNHWEYSWVPVVGPILGGLLAGLFFKLLIDLNLEAVPSL